MKARDIAIAATVAAVARVVGAMVVSSLGFRVVSDDDVMSSSKNEAPSRVSVSSTCRA